MGDSIVRWTKIALLKLPGVEEAEVDVVWDPPWDPSMMSGDAEALVG